MTTPIRRAASLRPGQFKHLIRVASVTGRLPERDVMLLWLTHTHTTGIRVTELALLKVADVLYPSGAIKSEVYRRADITKGCPTMARLTLTDFDEWLDGAVQTDVEDVYALHEAGLKECSVSATIPTGSAKNSESLAEAHESDLLKLIHGSPTVPEDAQLKRLLKDVERLNFWQAHDWYVGERTLNGEWRFFDADGNSCKGASLREALDQLKVIQPDLRGQMSDDDAWED